MEMPRSQLLAATEFVDDLRSSPLSCLNAQLARLEVVGDETGTPVGTIRIEGSNDARVEADKLRGTATALWFELEIPDGAVHGLGTGQALADGAVTWDGTNPLSILLLLEHPPRYLRVFAEHGSDGTGSSVAVYGSKRG